mmetsp:Transcript_67747/g.107338  ORF Transcript_67747/g.107338 Transcript_67747/m.107338 type:complete len:246 (-) Transcript_67747:449-1186(-)
MPRSTDWIAGLAIGVLPPLVSHRDGGLITGGGEPLGMARIGDTERLTEAGGNGCPTSAPSVDSASKRVNTSGMLGRSSYSRSSNCCTKSATTLPVTDCVSAIAFESAPGTLCIGMSVRPNLCSTKSPVAISVTRSPAAHASSDGCCFSHRAACGDKYGMFKFLHTVGPVIHSAQPRSTRTICPSLLMRTFSDHTSRCTMPLECISPRPLASWGNTLVTSLGCAPLLRISYDNGQLASISSITMHK